MAGKAVKADVARLLDANLNRAREGIRVIEDTARFLWRDGKLYKSLRRLRHDLHAVTAKHYRSFIQARDSEVDTGRKLAEKGRAQVTDVVAANVRRAQEAVRVLEEYSKVFSKSAGPEFKRIRYQLYIWEKRIWKKH